MKFLILFIKALVPISSIALALAGIVQLRSQIWAAGTICIVLAIIGFVFSIRLLEKNPFALEELEAIKPILVPAILWVVIIGLVAISVIYVADNVQTADTDRFATAAWAAAVILSLIVVWRRGNGQTFIPQPTSLRERFRENRGGGETYWTQWE